MLQNLEKGLDYTTGVTDDVAVRTMWRLLTKGWASRGRITEAGRAILASVKPFKGEHYKITVVKEEKPKPPILLPPIGGWPKKEEPS